MIISVIIMNCINIFLFSTIFLFANNEAFEKGILSPKLARVMNNGTIKIKLDTEMQYNICEITTSKNDKLVYNKTSPNETIITLTSNTDRIEWLGYDCGIILSSASPYSNGVWIFKAILANNKTYQDRSTITIISQPVFEKQIYVFLGSIARIDCNEGSTTRPTYCTIVDNFGNIVSENCIFTIQTVTLNNFGKWMCKLGIMGSMEELTHNIILKRKDEYIQQEVASVNNNLVMSCFLVNSNFDVRWCRAIIPNGEKLLLTQGLITARYSAFETNVTRKKCTISIKLPLLQKEIGQWRLDLGQTPDDFTGCFIKTPSTRKNIWKRFATPEQENINVIDGNSMTIKCSVPWPISYCYVRVPNETYIYASGFSAERIQRLGFCHIDISKVTKDFEGKWICGVSSYDGSADILFNKNVNVINGKIFSENKNMKVTLGMDLDLLCKSPTEEPMRYCRFISPLGDSFLVKPDIYSLDPRISYGGTHIDKGQCGIHIKSVQAKDIGVWTCATSFSANGEEYFEEIVVEYQKPSLAFSVGISISGIIVVIILVIGFIKMYKKRSNIRVEHDSPSVSSDDPLTSNENIPMNSLSSSVHRRYAGIN